MMLCLVFAFICVSLCSSVAKSFRICIAFEERWSSFSKMTNVGKGIADGPGY